MSHQAKTTFLVLALGGALVGCDGVIADPNGGGGAAGIGGDPDSADVGGVGADDPTCAADEPGHTPARVLSKTEWENTIADLLEGERVQLAASPGTGAYGFDNDALDLSVPPAVADAHLEGARDAAAILRGQLDARLECDRAEGRACAEEWLRDFGRFAYRRPVTDTELSGLVALWEMGGTFEEGIELATQGLLSSAPFLYRAEVGVPDEDGRQRLGGYEMASRLSYFLWASSPDAALLDAAAAGELDTADGVQAQAERMLEDPRARRSVRHLHRQWLALDAIDGVSRDPEQFPGFDEQLQDDLKEETLAFVEELVFADGRVSDLLDADFTMMNERVAAHYGVTGVTGEEMRRVSVDPEERAGLLTHAGIMAARASYDRTSPIRRGVYVRKRILCQQLPTPPTNIPELPEPEEHETERERLSRHRSDPVCASCHTLIDPLGFPFENYDAAGRYRDTDHDGEPVDARGEVTATVDANGPVEDAVDLSHRLAQSQELEQCVVQQWFRYAVARSRATDRCHVTQLRQQLGADFRLRDLVIAIVTSDPFRFRTGDETEAACE